MLKILGRLKVYTDRSLDSLPCDGLASPQGHSVFSCVHTITISLYCVLTAFSADKQFSLAVRVES